MVATGSDGTSYHYVIQYTGNMQDLAQYVYNSNWDLEELEANFQMKYSLAKPQNSPLNEQGLEKLFFKTLNEMGLNNKIHLQTIDNNGIINNIVLDSNNNPVPNPCPI